MRTFIIVAFGVCLLGGKCRTEAEVEHDRCVRAAKQERESCRKGLIKTTKRIAMCQEIYEKEMKICE